MEKTKKEIINSPNHVPSLHCHEIEDIMGKKPSWILRWGILILISIITCITAACCIIKYPQTVTASISLTSSAPPADLTARHIGLLDTVCVTSGDLVEKGQLIALIASTSNYYDIMSIERFIKEYSAMSVSFDDIMVFLSKAHNFQLGDIQSSWIELVVAYNDYSDYLRIDVIGKKKQMITEQIKCLKEKHHYLEKQQLIIEEDLYYERNAFVRDSMLYLAGAISLSDYEKARQSFIAKKNNLENLNALISNSHLSQIQLEQQLYELSTQRTSDDAVFRSRINKAIRSLDSQIALWKERYAIISPYNGTVSLQNVWSSGQYVADGDVIASIKPSIKSITMGRARVPSYSFGKVKVGQDVIIKLSGFPYMEFGILKGSVKSISPVPIITSDGIYYTIDVSLPYGLESSYHKELPFIQNMDGSAEIITEDMSVIEQFIRPIRSLFVNR